MTLPFPSEAWAKAFADAINQNEAYRTHGKPWTFGDVAMIVYKEPAAGIPEEAGMVLDVHEGQCRGVQYVVGEGQAHAAFEIIAPYAVWKEVIEGRLDPIAAMMQGKLDLRKGRALASASPTIPSSPLNNLAREPVTSSFPRFQTLDTFT